MPSAGIISDQVDSVVHSRPPKIGGMKRVEDAQRRTRQAWQRGEPEQLVGGEAEADRRQLRDHDRPHHPDREGEQQAGDRDPEVAPRDGAALLLPEGLHPRAASPRWRRPRSAPCCAAPWIGCISGSAGRPDQRRPCRLALHAQDRRHASRPAPRRLIANSSMKQEVPDAGEVVRAAPNGDRQDEAAQATDQPDDATDRADAVRVVDRDVLVHRRLAQAHEEAEDEDQHDEADHADDQAEGDRPADALHDVVGRRVGQDEGDRPPRRRSVQYMMRRAPKLVRQMPAIGAEDRWRESNRRRRSCPPRRCRSRRSR